MQTTKKYTAIISAEKTTAGPTGNLLASENLSLYLKYVLKLDVIAAVGHYQGTEETSFIIHTDSLSTVQHLSGYATKYLDQECILVSFNRDNIIYLAYPDGTPPARIGTRFRQGKGDGKNYTSVNGFDYFVQ